MQVKVLSDTHGPSALLAALGRESRDHPLDRKILVCARHGEGRELLRALAVRGAPWLGFEYTTAGGLAYRLIAADLADAGLALADEFDQHAMLDEALDEALEADDVPPALGQLANGVGFREAVRNAIVALRLAGLGPDGLRASGIRDGMKRAVLARVLAGYEARLRDRSRVDAAAVFHRAVRALERGAVTLPEARIHLLPGLHVRGARGRFLRLLRQRGASVLDADPVRGLDRSDTILWSEPPEPASPLSFLNDPVRAGEPARLELFAAASPEDELREVLRRVVGRGLRWDEVEIIATDPAVYGSALHSLSRRMGIPVTYAVGLPVDRTRHGRALAAYLRWVEEDFPADVIRSLLESGDLRAPERQGKRRMSGSRLARRLRRLRIGWGRDRYLPRIDGALGALEGREDDRAKWTRRELRALRATLAPILEAAPGGPRLAGAVAADATDPGAGDEGGSDAPGVVAPADLARGVLAFLERIAPVRRVDGQGGGSVVNAVELIARTALITRLERIEATMRRRTTFSAAAAVLRDKLEVRVPAETPGDPGRSVPWSSAGGHLHLADLDHGGLSGRPATFVVGLDTDRFPGAGLQDPLLLDADRSALNEAVGDRVAPLPTSIDRLEERRFALAALLARLRGRITLSYAAWGAVDGRTIAPAAVLLQAHRLATGNARAGFESLYAALGRTACPVPRGAGGGRPVDTRDVWLDTLAAGDTLREGVDLVRARFTDLDRGLRARAARRAAELGPHLGRIEPRPELLDPRRNPEIVLSSSRLEVLGRCPLQYLYRYVLRIRPPDDPARDPDVWLDALDRGRLLHDVFERALRSARAEGVTPDDPAFAGLAQEVLRREAASLRREVPAPAETVFRRELEGLAADVDTFVAMVRRDAAEWEELELAFGPDTEHPETAVDVGGGPILVRGRIDRVDAVAGDQLDLIDYKTGRTGYHGRSTGIYHGGRRLQHALYALAAESILGRRVRRFDYRFPTVKGENERRSFQRAELERGVDVIERLLDLVAEGTFVPTDDAADCRICDYRAICRARRGYRRGDVETVPVDWVKQHGEGVEEYRAFRAIREDSE